MNRSAVAKNAWLEVADRARVKASVSVDSFMVSPSLVDMIAHGLRMNGAGLGEADGGCYISRRYFIHLLRNVFA